MGKYIEIIAAMFCFVILSLIILTMFVMIGLSKNLMTAYVLGFFFFHILSLLLLAIVWGSGLDKSC